MRLPDRLKSIAQHFFPGLHLSEANKKIIKKIEEIEQGHFDAHIDYMKDYDKLSYEQVKEFYDETLNAKKSLEDKLKTSLFSVTVGITVMTSTGTFLLNDGISSLISIYKLVLFATGLVAFIYMVAAGVFSIKTISGHISVYQLFPEDLANIRRHNKKRKTAICAELNSLSNIIRQNLMNTSFRCIINSLIVITIFFVLIGISSCIGKKQIKEPLKVDIVSQQNQADIDLIKSKIFKQDTDNKNAIGSLQLEMKLHDKNISQISSSLEEIKRTIATRNSEIRTNKSFKIAYSRKPSHPIRIQHSRTQPCEPQ